MLPSVEFCRGVTLALAAIVPFIAVPQALAAGGEKAQAPSEAVFVAAIVVILLVSRLLGEVMRRLGQPAVTGQLLAGILLGPSVLGLLWPEAQHALFPRDPAQKSMLDAIAQFGVLLLLLLTGMDTDIKLIRKIGRAAVSVSLMGIAIPFICGVALGQFLPDTLIPHAEARLVTSLFLGTALSISSIKIVAMVVHEMDFMRRDLGQIIVASAIIDDSIGWIIIGLIFGIARAGTVELVPLLRSVVGVAIFLIVSLTLGRRAVSAAIRFVNDNMVSELPVITLILIIMGTMALVTNALGVQTVLGAFVAGILVGESPILTKLINAQLRGMVTSFFAPVFFALAGLSVDLTMLNSPEIALFTFGLILIASIGKFGGAFLGGTLGGLARSESLALAVGMNARGSTEVIVASIGLSMGALNQNLFTMIVTMAVLTTSAMPPTLRWALARVPLRAGEQERLEREAFESKGLVANMERLLLTVSESANGRFASHIAGLIAGHRGLPVTVLHLERGPAAAPEEHSARQTSAMVESVKESAEEARGSTVESRQEASPVNITTRVAPSGTEEAVSNEGRKGYDFLFIGLDPAKMPDGGFNPEIAKTVRAYDGPLAVAVARGRHDEEPLPGRLAILVPVTETDMSTRAAEIGVELARSANADLTILYVSPRDGPTLGVRRAYRSLATRHEESVLKDIVEIADRYDVAIRTKVAISNVPHHAIQNEADRASATLIILGVTTRPSEALLFGNTASELLMASQISLLFVAS
ncbi:transporter, CPA2 family [Rhizobiales bacterium GAS113]|nr:transporter, CPA2 family [Rhizobiales bacterium GAS113]